MHIKLPHRIPQMGFDLKRKRQPNLRDDPLPSLERAPTVEAKVMDDGEHKGIEQEDGAHQSEHKQNHPQMVAEESMPLPTTHVLASLRRVIPPSGATLLRRLLPHPKRSSRPWLSLLLPPPRWLLLSPRSPIAEIDLPTAKKIRPGTDR